MNLKDMTPGKTYQMGDAVFTVESVNYAPGQPCVVTAKTPSGLRTQFYRAALTTVTEVPTPRPMRWES